MGETPPVMTNSSPFLDKVAASDLVPLFPPSFRDTLVFSPTSVTQSLPWVSGVSGWGWGGGFAFVLWLEPGSIWY